MECTEYRINGSCDICHKNSSFANRTCNKCFYKLIGEYSKEVPKITVLEGNPKIEKWCKEFQKLNRKIIKLMSDNNEM